MAETHECEKTGDAWHGEMSIEIYRADDGWALGVRDEYGAFLDGVSIGFCPFCGADLNATGDYVGRHLKEPV